MTFRMASVLIIASLLFCRNVNAQPGRPNVHIGLIYPISTNGIYAGECSNHLSLHGIAGYSESELAFAGAGVTNLVRRNSNGVIIAGVSNHILQNANGLQAAGAINTIGSHGNGMMAAGALNVAGSYRGLQAAGFGNISKQTEGAQIAGFINVAGDVNTQLAGFINIAKHVSGVQMAGFINIADSSDYPIGFVNIVKNGSCGLGLNVDEALTTMLTLRSGGRIMYGIIGAGFNMQDNPDPIYALEAGLGAHIPITPHFRINAEISSTTLADFNPGSHFRSSFRILPAVNIANKLELFAGPTLNHATFTRNKGADLIHDYIWSLDRIDHYHGMYLGGLVGAHILL